MAFSSSMSRRDALKLGALGSAALLLPFERRAHTGATTLAKRMPSTGLPVPFTVPFAVPPVLQPVKRDETTDYYQVWQQENAVEILPGLKTKIYGYNGITPGPTVVAQRGRPVVMQQINALLGDRAHRLARRPQRRRAGHPLAPRQVVLHDPRRKPRGLQPGTPAPEVVHDRAGARPARVLRPPARRARPLPARGPLVRARRLSHQRRPVTKRSDDCRPIP